MDDLLIRPATPTDAPAVRRVVAAAFGDDDPGSAHSVADLVEALDASGHTRSSLVAEVDAEVVGHVQLNHSWLDARERLVDVLVLSPLSVVPSRQRAGIGTALLDAAVGAAEALGSPALFLEGSPDYYGRHGYVRASGLGFERPSTRIPGPAFQVRLLTAHEPWMTGRLVYCGPTRPDLSVDRTAGRCGGLEVRCWGASRLDRRKQRWSRCEGPQARASRPPQPTCPTRPLGGPDRRTLRWSRGSALGRLTPRPT